MGSCLASFEARDDVIVCACMMGVMYHPGEFVSARLCVSVLVERHSYGLSHSLYPSLYSLTHQYFSYI